MTKEKKVYNTLVSQAKTNVPGFAAAYARFLERVSIGQNSKSMIANYSRSLATIALHFNRPCGCLSIMQKRHDDPHYELRCKSSS